MSDDDLVGQLTDAELSIIDGLCQPYDAEGPVVLRRRLMLSLLNEVVYHRGHHAREGVLEIRSLVSMRDQKPYVTLEFGSTKIQLSTTEAIAHAWRILQVATGADADGFIYNFLRHEVGLDDQRKLSTVLQQFRAYRENVLGRRDSDDLPDRSTDEN
jgi:hypothetical protein